MFFEKFKNYTCHKANEALYFALFGVFLGLFFPYLESGEVATIYYASTACFQNSTSICSCPPLRYINLKNSESSQPLWLLKKKKFNTLCQKSDFWEHRENRLFT